MSQCGIPYLECGGVGLALIVCAVVFGVWLAWFTTRK